MAAYDRYDERERERERDRPRRYVREERWEERDARFDPQDSYLNVHPSTRDLVPRAREREESDLAVEEIRREFPPPGSRDMRRARSAEPIYEEYDVGYRRRYDSRYDARYDSGRDRDRDWDRDRDRDREDYYLPPARTSRRPAALGYRDSDMDDEVAAKQHASSKQKQEKLLAAIAGAALVMGAKEVYDRHEAKQNDERDVQRNYLASAAIGAAGALAGYQGADFYARQKAEKDKEKRKLMLHGRDGPDDFKDGGDKDKDKDDEAPGEKNFLEKLLAGGGIAAALTALTGKKIGGDGKPGDAKHEVLSKMQNAAKASLVAGATEAFHIAREPGGWKGEKTRRIFTAAAGAGTINAAQNDAKNSKLKFAESVIGGLVGNRVINGSKNNIEEDKKTGRSRSRSRAASHSKGGDSGVGGGAAGLAALLAAFGGKKVMDHYRNESPDGKDKDKDKDKDRDRDRDRDQRSRSRRRNSSDDDSDDDRPRRSRSRSVVDSARSRLAKLGIGNGGEERDSHRHDQDDFNRSSSRPRRRYSDDWDDDNRDRNRDRDRDSDRRRRRADDHDDDDADDDYYYDRRRDRSRPRNTRSAASESDLGDSDDDARQAKKLKGKQILLSTLAVAATIHAAHEVYESVEKREGRRKAVKEGRLSPEEAEKLKKKAIWQDAASVGIAALGIKSAVSTLKEVKEHSHACKEWKHEKELRHQKRLERQQQMGSQSRPARTSSLDRDDDHGYASDWDDATQRRGRTL